MSSIARRANVNQALIHYYFENKEQLYVRVLHLILGVDREPEFKNDAEFESLSPSQRLYAIIYFLVHTHLQEYDRDFNRIIAIGTCARPYAYTGDRGRVISSRGWSASNGPSIEGIGTGEFECENPMLFVLSLISFVLNYGDRENWEETPWFDRIFGEGYRERVLAFMLNHAFKALLPAGGTLVIPSLPEREMTLLKKTIEKINFQRRGEIRA
ncbi:MAG: TetR/AcrR family transcriptional regulator [Spirochaetota bacterium]